MFSRTFSPNVPILLAKTHIGQDFLHMEGLHAVVKIKMDLQACFETEPLRTWPKFLCSHAHSFRVKIHSGSS